MNSHPLLYINNRLLLFMAALFGSIIAVGRRTAWQVPLESAQVLAGLVTYPPDNPFYMYHMKSWSLLNHGAALLLSAGFSEFFASILIEGFVGAVSFAGIFLIVQAICEKSLIALLTPLLMYSLSLVGVYVAFPIALLGESTSYGILGLSYTLLVIGLLGTARYRSGAFLAGLAPAFHPALGAFCALIASLAVLANLRDFRAHLPSMFRYFIVGATATLASLAWQKYISAGLPTLDPVLKKSYLEAFIHNFDYHRTAGGWTEPGVLLGVILAALATITSQIKSAPLGARVVLSSVIASVATTFILVILSEFIPPLYFLKVLIPWRYINYASLCLIPVSFGILAADFPIFPRLRSFLLTAIITLCLFWRILALGGECILFFLILLAILCTVTVKTTDLPTKPFESLMQWQWVLLLSVISLFFFRQVAPGTISLLTGNIQLHDRTNSDILHTASIRPGILLTAGNMHLIQLVTRRPVLIDGGALDMFPYVPDSGLRFNEIMKKIYGLDIFVKPPDAAHYQGMLTYYHQALWEVRTLAEWQKIRSEFGVTDILTPISWNLKIPIVAKEFDINNNLAYLYWDRKLQKPGNESGLTLYTIP